MTGKPVARNGQKAAEGRPHPVASRSTILIVEDDSALRQIISSILELEGYAVLEAENGESALSMLKEGAVHLILSDVNMPGMDGYELFEQVRAHAAWAQIPFIFLTGKDERQEIRHGMAMGADDYLTKPFEPDELLSAVKIRLKRSAESQAAIRTAHELRDTIIRTLSHELRTPMALIMGYGELLEYNVQDMSDEEFHQSLGALRRGSKRLMDTVESCLLLSKLKAGATADLFDVAPREMAEPDEQLIYILDAFKNQAAAQNVSLDLRPGSAGVTLAVNHESFVEIVNRLVDNAIKFSKKEGGRVVLTTRQEEGFWRLDVADEGVGIDSDQLPLLFVSFGQVDREKMEQQGCGLGLSIVQELVKLYGGRVAVESELGQGSCFTVLLPLATP